jgi:uncharacterized delta-60 repeat protein
MRRRRMLPTVRGACAFAAVGLASVLLIPSGLGSRSGTVQKDESFGRRGVVITDLQQGSTERCYELLIQPDRKLVCVGASVASGSSEQQHVALARYLPTGKLDRSFGQHGIAVFNPGLDLSQLAASAVLDSHGRIVVCGVAEVAGDDEQDLFVARFNPRGTIDLSFGAHGFVTTDGSTGAPDLDWLFGIALQGDGKIVVGGQTTPADDVEGVEGVLLRYSDTGQLDESFGTHGIVRINRGIGETPVNSLLVQRDGKIVVGTNLHTGSGLTRYETDGRLDEKFSTDQSVPSSPRLYLSEVRAVLEQRDGKLLAAGWGDGAARRYAVLARYQPSGQLDPSFGLRGTVRLKLAEGAPGAGAFAAALQADGKIVLAGGAGGRFLVARYLKSGQPDPGFAGLGFAGFDVGGMQESYASAVRVQGDGRIVAAGAARKGRAEQEDFALVRLRPSAAPATRFDAFFARTGKRSVVVRWKTTSELGSRTFLLYRQKYTDERPAERNTFVGRLSARGGPTRGATYSLIDHPKMESGVRLCCLSYLLVEVKRDGRRVRYGPIAN